MRADLSTVIHAEHRFTGSMKLRPDIQFLAGTTLFFWMIQFAALSAMGVIAVRAASIIFSPRS